LGTPSLTAMGMKEPEMDLIAGWIDRVCRNMDDLEETTGLIRAEIADLCARFPIPGITETLDGPK
jgi:glycine/serine hydroxymethyltransferase